MRRGIETIPAPLCVVCGGTGTIEQRDLVDRLFGVPGRWQYRRCGCCGALWQDPMVSEAAVGAVYARYHTHEVPPSGRPSLSRRFYAWLTRGYLAAQFGYEAGAWQRAIGRVLALHPGRRADADFSAMYLPASSRGRVLDVGCGRGEMMELLSALGWSVYGIDVDPKAVEVTRSRGLPAECAAIWSDTLGRGTFDVIWMSHVIEHVHQPVEVLRRCRELLAPGGTLVAVTPNSESWGYQVFGSAWRGLEPPRHLQVFTRRSFLDAVARAGFPTVDVRITIRNARGIHGMSRAIQTAAFRDAPVESAPTPTFGDELWQMAEWLRTRWRAEDGEELVLIARTAQS